MKKKWLANAMAMVLAVGMVGGIASCGATEEVISDGKTVNVKITKAGYGSTFAYKLKEQFEKTFQEEGYKLNVLTPQRDTQGEVVLREIYGDSGVDVYFVENIQLNMAMTGEYGVCLTDLTENVYNQKPIKFDGTEEDVLIKDKLDLDEVFYDIKYTDGKYYGLPWVQGVRGLAVNTVVMEEYGLELPRTSDEFFHCFEVIMGQAQKTGIFPITHISTDNNYPVSFSTLWMAQYGGIEEFKQFWSMENADGTPMTENGYEVFESESIEKMLTGMFRAFDRNVATFGSTTQDLTTAQAQIMNGNCAFMMNGCWMLNEVMGSFSKKLNNVTFINVPVISDLAEKVFSKYNADRNWCDGVMSEIIGYVDSNTAIADIKTAIDAKFSKDFAVEDIQRIAEARGLYYNDTTNVMALINPNSEMKEAAYALLRMCASTEGANLIASQTNVGNPFTNNANENTQYNFVKGASAISNNIYKQGIVAKATGYRATLTQYSSIFPYTGMFVQNKIQEINKTVYNDKTYVREKDFSIFNEEAKKLQNSIVTDATNRW